MMNMKTARPEEHGAPVVTSKEAMLLRRRGSPRGPALVACAAALLGAAAACGGSSPSSPVPPSAAPRVRPAPPAVPPDWASWIQANHFPIRSTSATDTNFDDLQFLKDVIGDRRLVQLGESGHGVAEFDSVKVRLIQFLHQQMGFDVIAFESSLYECFRADEQVGALVADSLMKHCILDVWHADETLPLFDYIKAARGTSRPLILAGIDTQFTTAYRTARPGELRELLGLVDPVVAEEAYALDTELLRLVALDPDTRRAEIAGKVASMTAAYERIADLIDREQERLERALPSRPLFPRVMGRAMRMAPSLVRSLASGGYWEYVTIRDEGMADNVTWLRERLYPGRKILVWAHNYHIQHDATEISPSVTMGYHLSRRHREDLYTVGLFMYWGQATGVDHETHDVTAPLPNSLEALLGRTTPPASFVDLLSQSLSAGTAWMFQPIRAKSGNNWGISYGEMITPRRQYDGILFVDEVHPPHYR